MNRHWKGIGAILLFACLAIVVAMGIGRPMVAVIGVVVAAVIGFVLAIDWMRPRKPSNVPPNDGNDRFVPRT
ncbi:MAG TPA: hypothetical protein VFQ35_25415 [Polyangiaceae bacterium]|nr:hypothetical protein [Polyangiaceae bacterium]